MRWVLALAVLVLAAAMAGCIGDDPAEADPAGLPAPDRADDGSPEADPGSTGAVEADDADEGVAGDGPVLVMDLPIRVVPVGFEDFDEDRLLADLDQPWPSINFFRTWITGAVDEEPIQYDVTYEVHEAPGAFARDLFDYADAIAEPAEPTSFLESYDRDGRHRVCPEDPDDGLPGDPTQEDAECEDVRHVDAASLETWIAGNRSDYGLDFPEPGYTLFVLNHHDRGLLPRDTYHQYSAGDAKRGSNDPPLRAWGGNHDFVFLDVSAGPNAEDFRPWRHAGLDEDAENPPIWDHEDDRAAFYRNLARNVQDATRMLWARNPIMALEHADEYVLPFHVFVDTTAHANPDSPLHQIDPTDIPGETDEELVRQRFQELVPWADVETRFHYHDLPNDDPGMHEAIQDAKNRHEQGYLDRGVVKRYIDDNRDRYVPDEPGARVYPTFSYWLEYPSPGGPGRSHPDAWGDSWGVVATTADANACLRAGSPVCSVSIGDWWERFLIHEVGHSFGLHHPRDAGGVTDGGWANLERNVLWDSVTSAMSSRLLVDEFSTFDRDFMHRHQAAHVAADVLRDANASEGSRAEARQALELVQDGRYQEAVETARDAREAAGADEAVLESPGPGPLTRGEARETTVRVPAGSSVGLPATPYPWGAPDPGRPSSVFVASTPLSFATFPVDVPPNATAVEISYEEAEAPSHANWAAYAFVVNGDDDVAAFLQDNARDTVVLRAVDRCEGGCTGVVYGYGGAAMTYDVTVTPLYLEGAS